MKIKILLAAAGIVDNLAVRSKNFVQSGSRAERGATNIINDLGVDVFGRAKHIQAGALCSAGNFAAHTAVAAQSGSVLVSLVHHL